MALHPVRADGRVRPCTRYELTLGTAIDAPVGRFAEEPIGKEDSLELLIDSGGEVRCLYDEAINLHELGALNISRGSYVEPRSDGQWTVDLSPVNGPLLGPFLTRSEALAAEAAWLNEHWLIPVSAASS